MGQVAYDEFNDVFKVDARPKTEFIGHHEVSLVNYARWVVGVTAERFTTSTVEPIDISKYSEIFFKLESSHDVPIDVTLSAFSELNPINFLDLYGKRLYTILYIENFAPGETEVFSKEDHPSLGNPHVGLIFSFTRRDQVPTEGSAKLWLFGR